MAEARVPFGKAEHAQDIAKNVLFLASDATGHMTGSEHVIETGEVEERLTVKFATDSLQEQAGFELPAPLATARLSCQPDALSGVLFSELGFGLTKHQDGEGDGRQHTEAEQHPVEDAGSIS